MTDSILFIHDDPTLLRALGNRLEQAGSEVLRESSGEAGLALLERSHPDVICLGAQLAERNPDLVQRLMAREIPIIAFGGSFAAGLAARLFAAGVLRVVESADDSETLTAVARQSAMEGRRRRVGEALIKMNA